MVNVDDVVRERIEVARRKIRADRERRARQKRARDAGLALRHAAKLRNLAAFDNTTPAASGG